MGGVSPPERLAHLCEGLGLGPDPEVILDPLRVFYRRVDEALLRSTEGLDFPCRSGCSDCCYEAVFLSAPEFLAVAEDLLTRGTHLDSLIEQMRAIARNFSDELELLEELEAGPERDEVATRVRFRCPLLGSDERCTVYSARELNARTFGQTVDGQRSAPFGCERTHARLRVLHPSPPLSDARHHRRQMVEDVPGAGLVHVYPWWFDRYGDYLVG